MRAAPLMLLALLAGCAAPTGIDPPADGSEDTALLRGGEIELARGSDGALYAGGLDGASFAGRAWRSLDGGATWKPLTSPFADEPLDDGVSLARNDAGVLVAATLRTPQGGTRPGPCTMAASSTDAGATWSDPQELCTVSVTDRPWVVSLGSDIAILWRTFASTHELATSSDGKAWTTREVALPPDGGGRLAAGADALGYATPSPPGIELRWSRDGGATWTPEILQGRAIQSSWPALSLDDEGGAIVAGLAPRTAAALAGLAPTGSDVVVYHRGATGAWKVDTIDDGLNAHVWTAAHGGHLAVSWVHADDPDGDDLADEATEWRLRAWIDGEVIEAPDVLLRGALDRGSFGDYLGTTLLDDGTLIALVPAPADDPGSGYFDAPLRAIRIAGG